MQGTNFDALPQQVIVFLVHAASTPSLSAPEIPNLEQTFAALDDDARVQGQCRVQGSDGRNSSFAWGFETSC